MVKTKSLLLYIIAACFILLVISSFDAEFYFPYTTRINISDKIMYYAYTSNMDKLIQQEAEAQRNESEKKADTYRLTQSSKYIKNYKFILYYLSMLKYPETDKFDEAFQSAVLNYQQKKGLEVNGILNEATMAALDAEQLEYKEGQKGDAIKNYQIILKDLKYLEQDTSINGSFGSDTTSAVALYQQNNKLAITATLNAVTQESLKKPLAEQIPAK